MRIDLHAHSTASDGTESPSELMAAARAAGLTTIALTDHDTTAGWDEAVEAAIHQRIELVRGIEISCSRDYRSIHLLGYLPNPDDPRLAIELARARGARGVSVYSYGSAASAGLFTLLADGAGGGCGTEGDGGAD